MGGVVVLQFGEEQPPPPPHHPLFVPFFYQNNNPPPPPPALLFNAELTALGLAARAHAALRPVADSLSVPVSWTLLAEVCAASFLAPTSVVYAEKTLPLFTMPCAFVLRPGAMQTSGLMSTYGKALRQIEFWENEFQKQRAKERPEAAMERARANAAAAEGAEEGAAKRPRFQAPPEMRMEFTSGSVDGVVGRMPEPQNLSRGAAFLVEGSVFLNWITEQSAGSQSLVTQLTDRTVWDKVTVKDPPLLSLCRLQSTALGMELV